MANRDWGFCDLSVSKNFGLDKLHFLEFAGYNTVALNTHIVDASDEPKRKKKKGEVREKKMDFVPPPVDLPEDVLNSSKLNILQRVTIEFSDSSIAHKLNQSLNLKKYDIIAVIPKTFQAFQYACGSMDIDLITFEPESKFPFKISRKLYSQAVERGIFFEIMYSPAIRDSTSRKNIISAAQIYYTIGKSRNIVFSSGAENDMQIRDIHDVINFGFILGINANNSLDCVRSNTRKLILKAEARRCGKHYMRIDKDDNDTWHTNKAATDTNNDEANVNPNDIENKTTLVYSLFYLIL
ncbi:ribonuclease P protein subunit p30 [Trichoplusia ni]|uniref:Ribonuclease P protein subunit p30 n=1 Tax=Trichoplusia ni TaxID=7111 RepID=A0A7E5WBA4_TRINI|nr:ribonuclease P protein subunit p30 [Trichoplusia ni]